MKVQKKEEIPEIIEIRNQAKVECKEVTKAALAKSVRLASYTIGALSPLLFLTSFHIISGFAVFVVIAATLLAFLVGGLVILIKAEVEKHTIRKKAKKEITKLNKKIENEEKTHKSANAWKADKEKLIKAEEEFKNKSESLKGELKEIYERLKKAGKKHPNAPKNYIPYIAGQKEKMTIYDGLCQEIDVRLHNMEKEFNFKDIDNLCSSTNSEMAINPVYYSLYPWIKETIENTIICFNKSIERTKEFIDTLKQKEALLKEWGYI